MSENINSIKQKLIKAGKTAALELVKVAEKKLILENGIDDELAADKLKNAATAKKMAIFDAFDILDRIKKEEENIEEYSDSKPTKEKKIEKKLDFRSAEERS
jgi:hypothetical protein